MVTPLVRLVWALLACTNTFRNSTWKAAPVGGEAAAVHSPWPAGAPAERQHQKSYRATMCSFSGAKVAVIVPDLQGGQLRDNIRSLAVHFATCKSGFGCSRLVLGHLRTQRLADMCTIRHARAGTLHGNLQLAWMAEG